VAPSGLDATPSIAQLLAASSPAASLGTEVHRLLEGVNWLEDSGEDPLSWADDGDLRNDWTELAASHIRKNLGDGPLRSVLARAEIERRWGSDYDLRVENERPIAVAVPIEGKPTLVRGRIDRLVLGLRGERIERCLVVDFKTGVIDQHAAAQVAAYRQAVACMLCVDAETVEAQLIPVGPAC